MYVLRSRSADFKEDEEARDAEAMGAVVMLLLLSMPLQQEVDLYRRSGVGEPPETREKDKERGRKRKVLNRKIFQRSVRALEGEKEEGCPGGLWKFVPAPLQMA